MASIFKSTFHSIKSSFEIILRNISLIWIAIFIEIAFFFLYGLISTPLTSAMLSNLQQIGYDIISKSPSLESDFLMNAVKSEQFVRFSIYSIVLALITYSLYCVSHGFIWRFVFNLSGKKERYSSYIKKFFLVNIFWFILFSFYVVLNFIFYYLDTVAKTIDPNTVTLLEPVSGIFLLVILYFTLISYVFITKHSVWKSIKSSFKIGFTKLSYLVIFLLILISFYIINSIVFLVGKSGYWITILVGLLIVMPFMIYIRMLILKTVENYE